MMDIQSRVIDHFPSDKEYTIVIDHSHNHILTDDQIKVNPNIVRVQPNELAIFLIDLLRLKKQVSRVVLGFHSRNSIIVSSKRNTLVQDLS